VYLYEDQDARAYYVLCQRESRQQAQLEPFPVASPPPPAPAFVAVAA